MRWEAVKSTLSHEVYELWQHDQKLLTLTFHSSTNSTRVETSDERRVLMIRKEGFRKNKTVLRSEYGIKLGQLSLENKEPILEINGERFFCTIQNNDPAELVIYKETKENPLTVCALNIPEVNASTFFSTKKSVPVSLHSSLLLALCWYLQLPVAKNRIAEYSA